MNTTTDVKANRTLSMIDSEGTTIAPLFTILENLADAMQAGETVRIEQATRFVIFERTADGWKEVACTPTAARTWSAEKGWNG